MLQYAQGVDASHAVFNMVGRDQFNVKYDSGMHLAEVLATCRADTSLDSVSGGIIPTSVSNIHEKGPRDAPTCEESPMGLYTSQGVLRGNSHRRFGPDKDLDFES